MTPGDRLGLIEEKRIKVVRVRAICFWTRCDKLTMKTFKAANP
jgi:hypothetical protein